MLHLKVLICVAICLGLVQTKCIKNMLLEKVLQSNMSVGEKLEEVNKIVLTGYNHEENFDEVAATKKLIPLDPSVVPPTTQLPLPLPDIPTSSLWNPWTSLGKPRQYPEQHRTPSVSWNPWSNMGGRLQNWESNPYPQSSWNPSLQGRNQLNSYGNPFQSPPFMYNMNSRDSDAYLSLQNQIQNDPRSKAYYDARQTGMEAPYAPGSYSSYLRSSPRNHQHQESNSQMVENYPTKYNMLQNSINRLPYP